MLKRILPILIPLWVVGVQPTLAVAAEAVPPNVPGVSWGMLPGESLSQLARLIYPYSPLMQKRFAEASVALNRQQLPDLDANVPFARLTQLQIPDLKALAQTAPADSTFPLFLLPVRRGQVPDINHGATPDPQSAAIDLQLGSLEALNLLIKEMQTAMSGRLDVMEENMREMRSIVSVDRPRKPESIVPAKSFTEEKPAFRGGFALPVSQQAAGLGAGAAALFGWWLFRRRRSANSVVAPMVPPARPVQAAASVATGSALLRNKPVLQPPVNESLNDSMHVDEIESIVEEARVYVALGRSEQAVEMLEEYIEAYPRASVNPWMYLLDLHRAAGRKAEFSALSKRMHQTFNVMTPTWEASAVAMVVPTTLEEFPHILARLTGSWGQQECRDFLTGLVQDNRSGERAGFSIDVFEEILLLLSVLEIRETLK